MAEYELLPTQSEALDVTERDAASLYDNDADAGAQLERGECPWCVKKFDSPAVHARQKHPDEWAEYKGEESE